MRRGMQQFFLGLAALLLLVSPLWAQEFPGREKYPAAQPISTADLHQGVQAGKVVIVDVRSAIEYDVIHPVGAIHLPISDLAFEKNVQKLAADHPGRKLAFYCNGVTCLKSYEAAIRASEAGVKDSFAYDAGVPDWADKFPGETLLLGKPIVDPQKQLISKAAFAGKTISFADFQKAAAEPNSLVIDVRDHVQRSKPLPGFEKALTIPLDNFIPNFVKKKANQDKKLLIFDQVGKQVMWLDYYLVEYGYKDYVFLKDGATGVLGTQEYK